MAKRIKSNSDYTDHPSVYQSMLISFTSLLLQGVSNERQRRVNLAIADCRGITAIRELYRTRDASRQAFSQQLFPATPLCRLGLHRCAFAANRREACPEGIN